MEVDAGRSINLGAGLGILVVEVSWVREIFLDLVGSIGNVVVLEASLV